MPATLTTEGRRALDEVAHLAAQGTMPAFVYGVTSLEEEIYFTSHGTRVLNDPSSGQVDPDSTFWICSQTKMIGHLAALQLIERGQLSYDAPVSDYFPEFKKTIVIDDLMNPSSGYKPTKTIITVKHLLTFTSGLAYEIEHFAKPKPADFPLPAAYTYAYSETEDPKAKFFEFVKGVFPEIPLKFEPGTDYAYGWGSDLLGFIVEKISGQSLEDYCQTHIFKPLGIKASFYLKDPKDLVEMSYRRQDGKLERWADQVPIIERPSPPESLKIHLAGVGVYTSLRDYLALLRHLLQIHAGTAKNPIAKRETVLSMFEPVLNRNGASSVEIFLNHPHCQWSTALAVCSADWAEGRKRGSAFWLGWANTHYHMDPESGIAAVYGTQLNPFMDPEVTSTFARFERALYDGLVA
ncbi:beta-lactamase/transpeptidase-like protein [Panaeolus papilionaceus]|nr:beta-lactamase/transpeptidase-like protein [Panaeolus papilionaceus]